MSLTKRMMEAGYKHSDKFVCAECFDDYAIKNLIEANLTASECSFCRQEGEGTNIAADGNAVIEFILSGIRSEYSTVNNEWVLYDPEDQEYIVPTTAQAISFTMNIQRFRHEKTGSTGLCTALDTTKFGANSTRPFSPRSRVSFLDGKTSAKP